MKPKILVGCPTSNYKKYCLAEYSEAVKNLSYDNYDILLVDNSEEDNYFEEIKSKGLNVIKSKFSDLARDRIISSRNLIREKVLTEDYDYFLSLEQDVIPPKDVIEKLLKWNKKVVSGVVFHLMPQTEQAGRKFLLFPMFGVDDGKGKYTFLKSQDVMDKFNLIKIDYCSMGCLLIHRSVLEKLKFRYELTNSSEKDEDNVLWDDMCFCRDVKKLGIDIHGGNNVKCKHLIMGGYCVSLGSTKNASPIVERR